MCQSLHFAKIEHIYHEQKPCSGRHRTMLLHDLKGFMPRERAFITDDRNKFRFCQSHGESPQICRGQRA